MTFSTPWFALALVPWAWLLWRASQRGRVSHRVRAPLWTLRAPGGGGWDAANLRHRDLAWWWLVATALLTTFAAMDPRWSSPRGRAGSDVVVDAGLIRDVPAALAGVAADRWWGAGLLDPGPYPTPEALRVAPEDPRGPTVGEILSGWLPPDAREVRVVAFGPGPADRPGWTWTRVREPRPRLHTVTRDATGRISWRGAAVDTVTVVTAEGRRRAPGPSFLREAPAGVVRIEVAGAPRALEVVPAERRRVYLLAPAGDPWIDVVGAWPDAEVATVDRDRWPARDVDWSDWMRARGGPGLVVVVGAAPPRWPATGWLWIAPRAGGGPGLRLGATGDPTLAWDGLDLSAWPRSRPWVGTGGWTGSASGRVWERPGAAGLNLDTPHGTEGRWTDAAVASWRLARRLQPAAESAWAGPGPPSAPSAWPSGRPRAAAAPRAIAGLVWILAGLAALLAGWSWASSRRSRFLVGAGVLGLAVVLLWAGGRGRGVLVLLDVSPSCRTQIPAAFAEWRASEPDPACAGVLALDGEGATWGIAPGEDWPSDPRAWAESRLEGLATSGSTRWAEALAGAALPAAGSILVFGDGGFTDAPAAITAALPAVPVYTWPVPAGRPGDAAIVEVQRGPDATRVRLDPGGGDRTLEVERAGGKTTLPADRDEVVLHATLGDPPRVLRLLGPADAWPQNDVWSEPGPSAAPRVRWLGAGSPSGAEPPAAAPDVWILADATREEVRAVEAEVRRDLDAGAGLVVVAGPSGFLATEPAERWPLADRLPVRPEVPADAESRPTTWMFLLDVSGSMAQPAGEATRLDEALLALGTGLAGAGPRDRVGLVAFADRPRVVVPPAPGRTARDLSGALAELGASGGTALGPALTAALGVAGDGPRRLVLLTDGLTAGEDPATWIGATDGARCDVLELGAEGSPGLRALATATGGEHATATGFQDLGRVLARDLLGEAPARLGRPGPPAAVVGWEGALPPGPFRVLRMTADPDAATAWTVGADPALVLAERGGGRVAVLCTSPGPPWAPADPAWPVALGRLVDWVARRQLPQVDWPDGRAPRLRLGLGLVENDAALALQGADGTRAALDPVGGGVYRARDGAPRAPVAVVAGPGPTPVARVRSTVPDEWRQRGVRDDRLARLGSVAAEAAGGRDPRGVFLVLLAGWAGAVALVLRRGREMA